VKKVQVITDGACLGNPGRGGWAAILRHGEHSKEIYGCEAHTTNNRMELTAAIEGLKTLRERCDVEVVTDSEYMKNGITQWTQAGTEPRPVGGARFRDVQARHSLELDQGACLA
jgi:ribonuclease HI